MGRGPTMLENALTLANYRSREYLEIVIILGVECISFQHSLCSRKTANPLDALLPEIL